MPWRTQAITLAGTTVLRFDSAGLVVDHVDYWMQKQCPDSDILMAEAILMCPSLGPPEPGRGSARASLSEWLLA